MNFFEAHLSNVEEGTTVVFFVKTEQSLDSLTQALGQFALDADGELIPNKDGSTSVHVGLLVSSDDHSSDSILYLNYPLDFL